MIIDKNLIAGGITPDILYKLIHRHTDEIRERFQKLYDYYCGIHEISTRPKQIKGASNSKIAVNHAKYIVDTAKNFITGNPVTYETTDEVDITALKKRYTENHIAQIDNRLAKDMGIFGRAYELVYMDESSKVCSAVLDPRTCFVVYANSVDRPSLFAVQYYLMHDINGCVTGSKCVVYDSENTLTFTAKASDFSGLKLIEQSTYYFGEVPVIEYSNNDERQGDFEQFIPLIDAYNSVMSDRVDDKHDFVDAFLFLRNIEVDEDGLPKLRNEKILMSDENNSDVKYLSKIMMEADVKVLRDDLKEDIHRLSSVPDLSDESFGNNLSGVAIKYKLLGFEQIAKDKEAALTKGLQKRFTLYVRMLTKAKIMKEQSINVFDVDIKFTHNLPANELEVAQMITYLKGTVSNETLIAQLPFINDAKEENQLLTDEKAASYNEKIRRVELIARGGGYGNTDQY